MLTALVGGLVALLGDGWVVGGKRGSGGLNERLGCQAGEMVS